MALGAGLKVVLELHLFHIMRIVRCILKFDVFFVIYGGVSLDPRMLSRAVSLSARVATRAPANPVRLPAARSFLSFDNDKQIRSDDDQQAGRRKQELDDAKKGLVRFELAKRSGCNLGVTILQSTQFE